MYYGHTKLTEKRAVIIFSLNRDLKKNEKKIN